MRISDWSSDVCSSDLAGRRRTTDSCRPPRAPPPRAADGRARAGAPACPAPRPRGGWEPAALTGRRSPQGRRASRSEEHTSELQSLMRITYAVFCLKTKKKHSQLNNTKQHHYTQKIDVN